jgi:cysteine synthase
MSSLSELQEPLTRVGQTAEVRFATPLVEVAPRLLLKLECNNQAGSHKVRAARKIVQAALKSGAIVPGKTTVIEKTGGNFGFGLATACAEIGVPVELAVGLSFSPAKRRFLEYLGAKLIGIDMLKAGAKPREVIESHLARADSQGKHYFYTDQFSNPGSLAAHFEETGPEIAAQLSEFADSDRLVFVSCAGTGASLTGIARALRASGVVVDVVLVEPEGCDSREGLFVEHPFEGMSVGVPPPFLDWSLVSDVRRIGFEKAKRRQRQFSKSAGLFLGHTSAACLDVAYDLIEHKASAGTKVLSIAYDHGLWYLNTVFDQAA